MATKHKFARGEWNPVHPSKKGAETAKAKRRGVSLHQQAEKDSHSSDPKVRGRGVFALNAQAGKFHHRATKRRSRSRA
jgi:hypothetical protein